MKVGTRAADVVLQGVVASRAAGVAVRGVVLQGDAVSQAADVVLQGDAVSQAADVVLHQGVAASRAPDEGDGDDRLFFSSRIEGCDMCFRKLLR